MRMEDRYGDTAEGDDNFAQVDPNELDGASMDDIPIESSAERTLEEDLIIEG